jgi:hypothetical protein
MIGHWDERYAKTEGAYGRKPVPFWVQELSRCKGHSVLLPCEGEGRNALWAAQQGWEVHAVDSSAVGMATCDRWCKAAGVEDLVQTYIEDALTFDGNPRAMMWSASFTRTCHPPCVVRFINKQPPG